jgi:hypothetical protein
VPDSSRTKFQVSRASRLFVVLEVLRAEFFFLGIKQKANANHMWVAFDTICMGDNYHTVAKSLFSINMFSIIRFLGRRVVANYSKL